jgi:hypothetical protein
LVVSRVERKGDVWAQSWVVKWASDWVAQWAEKLAF